MNRKVKSAIILNLLLCVILLVSACSTSSNTSTASDNASTSETTETTQPTERILEDAMGNEVEIPANPQSIIASYLEDHLVALGVKPAAQWSIADGTSVQNYLQDSLNEIPTIPSDLPFEAVMSFSPDLILMDTAGMVEGDKYEQYSKIAPTYVVASDEDNDWRKKLLRIGEVLNKSDEAKEVLENYDLKAKEAKEQLEQEIGTKPVAILWVTAKSIYVPNVNLSSGAVLYGDLGLTAPQAIQEVSETGTANWNALSLEKLAEMEAEYVFIVNGKGVTKDELLQDPVWAGIPAVKNGRVYEYDKQASWLYTGAIANLQMIDNVMESILK